MIYNFEEWRKAKMASFEDGRVRHYHRVDAVLWLTVSHFLQNLLVCRVESFGGPVSVSLPDSLCDYLMRFLDEMECAYIHPRSSSARVRFSESIANQSLL